MFAQLVAGHVDLADFLYLLAAIFAGFAAVVPAVGRVALLPVAVALVAAGFFVL